MKTFRSILAFAALAIASMASFAAQSTLPEPTLVQATAIFATCDKASVGGMLSAGDAATCSIAYEVILRDKFHGDFKQFLAWWKTNGAKAPSLVQTGYGTLSTDFGPVQTAS